ncbi:histidine phosphatase family protein [Roseococcus sp. SYP-B2431]|uniref:histidine phosphatase family protein n=1 Tax=Roseococcus sp. SYP-B2431 TaxID=2496640 RepID=UPI00103D60FC|nr:histidine phosphatase family protein [Roseococcus sp. SYP-B2431]TCH98184.1 histidine phosphatase family protein [Roseococcus sp. SYP-B2431]
MRRALLLRHPQVAPHWAGRCYGRSDVGLSTAGRAQARRWAARIRAQDFDRVIASPARRSRWPAGLLSRDVEIDPRLAERDFSAWEGLSWDAIWRAEGDAMDGMIDAPERFRPGGGETTSELAARALSWWQGLAGDATVLAVTHGGPIGVLAGSLLGLAPRGWLAHVPKPGEGLWIAGDAISPWTAP